MKLVVFGLPLAALLLRRDGHDVGFVAVCRRDALGLRRLKRELGGDRVAVVPRADDPALAARVAACAPDLFVSWFWTTRLPMELIRLARLGGIGVHPSLLPRHRGPDPTYWTIASGDVEAGVTAHRIEQDYDTGAILAQERLAVDPGWDAWQLARALDRPSLRLLRSVVARLARGERIPETPQDEALATDAPFPADEDTWISWSWPTERILRHVRALAPAPGALTSIGDATLTVLRAEAASSFPRVLLPGEAAGVGGRALVRTSDGAIVLLEALLHPEGGPEATPRLVEASELAAIVAGSALRG